MRLPILALILCIALAPLAAAATDYWTVVADDGKAADVVNAANFAASMKASASVTFTGKTASEARAAPENPFGRMEVSFQGDNAWIEADDRVDDFVVDTAEQYLRDQGFDMTVELFKPEGAPIRAKVETEDVPEIEDEVIVGVDAPQEDVEPPQQEEIVAQAQKPNVFVRMWRWFAGLF